MKAVYAKIHGRVQGVWFRASTREEADRLGVSGWVRNTVDGAVELHAQGEAAAVKRLIDWCESGPPGARVDRVHAEEALPEGGMKGFHIRY